MGNTIQIQIPAISNDQAEILIAELSEINFDAFVQNDSRAENENTLSAFIKEENFNEALLSNILPENISYTKSLIEETNWNEKWESEFEPVIVNNFVAIRAFFHKPIHTVSHEIIITPKMSFGTGHHATTCLMMQQMQHMDFNHKTVLDFGTGTGVLAILAKKLGAKKVIAIDNDEWSIQNTKENIITNNCSDILVLKKNDLNGLEIFDIILANINLNVICDNCAQLKRISHQSTQLLLSGFLDKDENLIRKSFTPEFKIVSSAKDNEWLSMLLIKS